MTPFARGTLLRAVPYAPAVTLDALASRGVLVMVPHPDDETLACGGALATLAASGRSAHVVVTDGGGSHPGSTDWPRTRIAEHRAQEFDQALQILGSGRISYTLLGHPDQDIPRPTDPGMGDTLAQLALAMTTRGLDTIWTTWEGDPHVDHVRCAALARGLSENVGTLTGYRAPVWRCPVWGRFVETPWPTPTDKLLRFETTEALRAIKAQAVACHASQMTTLIDDDPTGFMVPVPMQRHFIEHDELFLGGADS